MSVLLRSLALSPMGSLAPAWPSVWYPMHEGTGSVLAERLRSGPPLNMQGGALGTSGRYGSVRPNPPGGPQSQYATTGTAGSPLDPIFSLVGMQGQQLLLGLELECETGVTAGGLISWGQTGSTGSQGGWCVRLGTGTNRPLELVVRGRAAPASVTYRLREQMPRGPNSRCVFVVQMIGIGPDVLTTRVYLRPFSPADSDPQRSTAEPVTLVNGGSGPPGGGSSFGLSLFAERLRSGTLGGVVGRAWFGNFWAQRRTTVDESLGLRCCADMVTSPREFPASLRG